MHNQHAGLSQTLAEQHITQQQEKAAQAWLARGARPTPPSAPVVDRKGLVAAGSGSHAPPWSSQSSTQGAS